MKKLSLGLLIAGLVLGLTSSVVLAQGGRANGPQWMDATHIFDAQVQKLVQNVKLETKAAFAKRTKAPQPKRKEYALGDVEKFWTKNIKEDKFEETPATLRAIGTHCYVFVENGKNVSDKAVAKVQKSFDETIYPINTSTFGSEWKPGVDGDERIFLLMFDIKDGYDGSGGFVGGYFFAGDEFLQSQIPENVPVKSNEREMFYLDINPSDPESDTYMAIVAHEFQHMIHFANDPREATWVNESCSQIAPYLCGFGHANQIVSLLKEPDNSLTAWAEERMLANYGHVYLWNYYLMNRFLRTDASRASFFKNLVADKASGIDGFNNALQEFKIDFGRAYSDFALANFINDPKLEKGKFAYDNSLGRLRLPPCQTIKTFPGEVKDQVFLWSADAIKVDLSSARTTVKVEFAGAYAKFTDKKFNSFMVAAVLSDSRGKVDPTLQYVQLQPVADKNVQVGAIELSTSGKFDTLMIVVSAQAPGGIPDQAYAKAPGLPYLVRVSDSGIILAGATTSTGRRSIRPYAEEYVRSAGDLGDADEKIASLAFTNVENMSFEITKSVRQQLDEGSFEAVDELITLSTQEGNRDALRPLARRVADQLKFAAGNGDNPEFASRIKALTSF